MHFWTENLVLVPFGHMDIHKNASENSKWLLALKQISEKNKHYFTVITYAFLYFWKENLDLAPFNTTETHRNVFKVCKCVKMAACV